jgi:hypothetical protein
MNDSQVAGGHRSLSRLGGLGCRDRPSSVGFEHARLGIVLIRGVMQSYCDVLSRRCRLVDVVTLYYIVLPAHQCLGETDYSDPSMGIIRALPGQLG